MEDVDRSISPPMEKRQSVILQENTFVVRNGDFVEVRMNIVIVQTALTTEIQMQKVE